MLSVGQLLEKCYPIVFKNEECLIVDPCGCKLILIAISNKSFVVDWNSAISKAYTTLVDESMLWHKRMSHVNYKPLSQFFEDDLVENLSKMAEHEEVCEVCKIRKHYKLPFPVNKAWKATKKLYLVHIDVYGPMRTQSLSGRRYFILFIYDYSMFCQVHFLRLKFEVAHVF